MKILSRYLEKTLLLSSLSIVFSLTIIILITQSFKYVDFIVSHGTNHTDFFYLLLLLLPSLINIILPICIFIAVMYSLNKLNLHRELSIIKGFGLSNFKISKPFLKIVIFFIAIHYSISLYVMPEVNSHFKKLTKDLKESYISFYLKEKVFHHPTMKTTFYIKEKVGNNKFNSLFYQEEEKDKTVTIIAQSGEIVKKEGKIYLSLEKGNRQETNNKNELNILNFNKLWVELNFDKTSNLPRNKQLQEKHILELIFPPSNLTKPQKLSCYAEAVQRLTWPIYNLILTLIALTTFLEGDFRRSGKTKRIILFSSFAALIIILNNSLINLSSTYPYIFTLVFFNTFGMLFLLYQVLYSYQNNKITLIFKR